MQISRNLDTLLIKLASNFSILMAIVSALMFPAQVSAQEARFGYSVATTTVELEVFSPNNDLNYYGWSFDGPCNGSACYEEYSQGKSMDNPLVIENMRDYVGSGATETDIHFEVYDESGNNLLAEKSVTISLGSGVDYGDADGDGILDNKENSGCVDDPDPDCGDGGDDDDDDNDDEDVEPPSDGLVNCGRQTEVKTLDDGSTTTKLVNPCGYDDLINLVSIVIRWLIGILVLVATLLFTYAGFLYLGADGNSNRAEDAKNIFTNVAFGFAIVLVSVLFITTLVTMFTSDSWEDTWMDVVPLPELSMQVDKLPEDDNVYS